jgi:hypothetical protein
MTAEEDPQASAADAIGAGEAATGEAAALPEPEPDDLLHEFARAMHTAALSQHQRMVDEVRRLRAAQAEMVKARASSEAERVKKASQADIKEIDAWAKTATELIAAERVRRIDARRERLQAELARQDIIAEREVMAVEVTLEDHEAALEAFFARLEGETDPASIAQLASSAPSLPSLSDAAEAARRHAITEFAPIDETNEDAARDDEAVDDGAEVSPSRLMAVMDTSPWPEPRVVAVPAGAGAAAAATDGTTGSDETLAPVAAGSRSLLRSTPAARPTDRLLGWNRKVTHDPDRKD